MQPVSKSLCLPIERPACHVYEYFCQPLNLSRWSLQWIGEAAPESLLWRFTERNAFGVLDFAVQPAGGASTYVQLRVVANEERCSLLLTLFRRAGMTEDDFAAAAQRASRELLAAKALLEAQRPMTRAPDVHRPLSARRL